MQCNPSPPQLPNLRVVDYLSLSRKYIFINYLKIIEIAKSLKIVCQGITQK